MIKKNLINCDLFLKDKIQRKNHLIIHAPIESEIRKKKEEEKAQILIFSSDNEGYKYWTFRKV